MVNFPFVFSVCVVVLGERTQGAGGDRSGHPPRGGGRGVENPADRLLAGGALPGITRVAGGLSGMSATGSTSAEHRQEDQIAV